jgi:hypothetical protein
MTGAMERLREAGFQVRLLDADRIGITPAEHLTERQRQWVIANRAQLLDELIHAANDPDDWQHFVSLVVGYECTAAEVEAMFTTQDKVDLLEEPRDKLPLHAKTITDAIKRKRMPVVIELAALRYAVNPVHIKRCFDCQHFNRIDHPHLGTCAAGEPEGIAGNWDTDNRDYCQQYHAVQS